MAEGSKAPTLDDVAERAGVSSATVSRFLNNPGVVAKETGVRISAAIDETGYIPNALAGGLASNRSRTVAVLIPHLENSLFNDTIEKMVDDAKRFEEEDKKRRDAVENRNALEAMVLQTEKLLGEHGDKLPDDAKTEIKAAIDEANESIKSSDNDRIVASKDKLTQASHKLAQAMYGQPGADGAAPGGADAGTGAGSGASSGASGEEEVIDAEFEEKKD